MKTKLIFTSLLAVAAGSASLHAQNASSYSNGAGISGTDCSAFGYRSLSSNTSGGLNSGGGAFSLFLNTVGKANTAHGHSALYSNVNGSENVAIGVNAGYGNNGSANTLMGTGAGYTGNGFNRVTALGYQSLYTNTIDNNSAVGYQSLFSNTTGDGLASFGMRSFYNNTNGSDNTGCGYLAGFSNINGSGNVAIGHEAFYGGDGSLNTLLGDYADVASGVNSSGAIGGLAFTNVSNQIYIGNSTTDVWCQAGVWNTSDQRFKTNVKADDIKGLEFIKLLRPVAYNFDLKKLTEYRSQGMSEEVRKHYLSADFSKKSAIRQTGFLAQEVEAAAKQTGYDFSGLHTPENDHDTYGLNYSQFVVPLVKAVQEQQTMIDDQKTSSQQQILDLQNQINDLKQQLAASQAKANVSTGIAQINPGSGGFAMEQNEPNPFSHETTIRYTLPQSVSAAVMNVYDLSGKQITSYSIGERGSSSLVITSEKLPAGIYIYSIIADGKIVDSKRMIVANK